MQKFVFIAAFLLLTGSCAIAQYQFYDDQYLDNDVLYEAGMSLGFMLGSTDVGEKKGSAISPGYYDWKSAKLCASVYYGILYQSTFEARAELTLGGIVGSDVRGNTRYVLSRNLSYKSKIFELALIGAFHPLPLFYSEYLPAFSPYIMAGVGIFSFYPKTYYKGEFVKLRRMNTEGQNSEQHPARTQYSLRAISIPIGGGLKYEFNAKFNFRFEILYRLTNSDYLDDVSTTYPERAAFSSEDQFLLSHRYKELKPTQDNTGSPRGNPATKDKFFTITLRAGYVLGREKKPTYSPDSN